MVRDGSDIGLGVEGGFCVASEAYEARRLSAKDGVVRDDDG